MKSLGKMYQLGYAVKDVMPWVENYLGAGVGPFWIFRHLKADTFKYLGTQRDAYFDCAVTFTGELMIEIVSCKDDLPSPFADYLASGREGLQHVAFAPKDVAAAHKELLAKGYEQTLEGNTGGFAFSYFSRPGVDSIEVCELSDDVFKSHRELEQICATWDGTTEPIREQYALAE